MCQSAHSGTEVCRVTSGFLVRSSLLLLLLLVLVFKIRHQNGSIQEAYPIVASMMLNRRRRSWLLAPDRVMLLMHISDRSHQPQWQKKKKKTPSWRPHPDDG